MPESDMKPAGRKVNSTWADTSNFNRILFNRGDPAAESNQNVPHIKTFSKKYVEMNQLPPMERSGRGRGLPPIDLPKFRSSTSLEMSSNNMSIFDGKARASQAADVISSRPNIFELFNPSSEPFKLRTHFRIAEPRPKPQVDACVNGFRGVGNLWEASIMPKNERPNRELAQKCSATPLGELKFYGQRKYL